MGSAVPFSDELPFEEKVKCLADDELLEIWAESQQMENMLGMRFPGVMCLAPDYEQTILTELFLRVGRKLADAPKNP